MLMNGVINGSYKLNASKCKSLTVSGCKSTIVTNYSVLTAAGRQDLERVNNIKDMGLGDNRRKAML